MQVIPTEIIERQFEYVYKSDPVYGAGIARALGIREKAYVVAAVGIK